eukprot:COSAG05_NODE_48_length_24425_cov_90.438543_2_plen_95_part_00
MLPTKRPRCQSHRERGAVAVAEGEHRHHAELQQPCDWQPNDKICEANLDKHEKPVAYQMVASDADRRDACAGAMQVANGMGSVDGVEPRLTTRK